MAKYNPNGTGRATRPIIHETYSSDILPIWDLAVHQRVGIRSVGNVPSGPRVSVPVVNGARIPSFGKLQGGDIKPLHNSKFR